MGTGLVNGCALVTAIAIRREILCSHSFEQTRDANAQSIGEHLDGIDRRVGASCFNARHVRPGEAAPISKSFLAHAHSHTELPDSGAELVLKRWGGRWCWHSPMVR